MGKGGTILGLIGVLLGAGALGFGFYTWYTQPTEYTPGEMWHRYYEDIYDVDTINTYLPIPNMTISIDLTIFSSIELLFTCLAYTDGTAGRSDLTFNYYIDELIISNPNARVGTYDGEPTTYYHSVSLHYFSEGWTVGVHNITVFVRSTVAINSIQYCALMVQSYPS